MNDRKVGRNQVKVCFRPTFLMKNVSVGRRKDKKYPKK